MPDIVDQLQDYAGALQRRSQHADPVHDQICIPPLVIRRREHHRRRILQLTTWAAVAIACLAIVAVAVSGAWWTETRPTDMASEEGTRSSDTTEPAAAAGSSDFSDSSSLVVSALPEGFVARGSPTFSRSFGVDTKSQVFVPAEVMEAIEAGSPPPTLQKLKVLVLTVPKPDDPWTGLLTDLPAQYEAQVLNFDDGRTAFYYHPEPDTDIVEWYETDGLKVNVVGIELDKPTVIAAAESIEVR